MKNKKILALTTVIALSTTTLAFANEIKMVKKNGQDYVPFRKLVKNLGGEVEESKDELKANIDSTQIIIKNQSSFVKVDGNYYPLEKKEMNGYKVPINTKPIYEDKELYISPEFLRSANLVNFDIEGGKLIIDNKVEKETTSTAKEKPKKEEAQSSSETKEEEPKKEEPKEKPKGPVKPSKPNRPNNNNSDNTNNNQNNNNSNNSNSDNSNNNQNNGLNEDDSSENNSGEDENEGSTNEDNSQNRISR